MAGKLILHIGHYKTGTTALQVFMARNRADFLARGLDYTELRRHNAKHSAFAFSLLRAGGAVTLMHGYSDPTPPEAMWAELFAAVQASPAEAVLVSSEEFMRIAVFPAAAARLQAILEARPAGIEVLAIAYLRAPGAHLRSWFNQLVKMGQPMPDYVSALQGAIEPVHIDYGLALAPWRAALGDDRVILRPYAPRRDDPTRIYHDFTAALGLGMPAVPDLPPGDPNPRIDDRVLDLVRVLQNAGMGPRMVEALRDQALRWLDAQAAAGPARPASLGAVRAQAAAGIAALEGMPLSGLDTAALAADLPADFPDGPPAADPAGTQMDPQLLGFALAELATLRRWVNRTVPDALEARLARLEAAAGLGPIPAGAGPAGSDAAGSGRPAAAPGEAMRRPAARKTGGPAA
jgi:hypothetical protein